MKMHEDGTSKSSGYVEIPIQVLYKTEYIDSVVQQRKKTKSLTNIMKKAKLRITNTFGKLRDRISSALRGYYQEIIINNVDGKTRQNMIGYIKSMNLETKEFLDGDGTRVIIVDIAPIKKKPEMNDLLVYIENEKLKIARRTEARSRGLENKEQDLSSNKWSVQNPRETSVCDTTTQSEKTLQVHPRGGGDGIMKSSKAIVWERDKTRTKHKSTRKKGTTEKNNSIKNGVSEIRSNNNKDYTISSRMLHSKEVCLEDPLTIAERRVKLRMRSKSKATVRTDSTWCDQDKSCSKTIYTCQSSSAEDINNIEMSRFNSSTVGSSSDRMGWSINSFINPQMNGIGVFWNAESVMYNDTKINLIERSNAIKDKEMSVNVIAQYYNKEDKNKLVEVKPDIIRTPHYEEKGTEIDDSICITEMKATKETHTLADTVEEKASATKSKINKRFLMDNQRPPTIQIKDVELYVTNSLTSQPSFQFETIMTKIGPSKHDEMKINKSIEHNKDKTEENTKNNKKKKRKFTKFCKKLFTNKNQTKKEPEHQKVRNKLDDSEEVPVEVFVKYTPTNHNGKAKGSGKQPIDVSKNKKKLDRNFANKYCKKQEQIKDDCIVSNIETFSRCPTDYSSKLSKNVYYATDKRHHWYDRGDNLKTLADSNMNISEIEVPQSSKKLFNWETQVERMKEKRNKRRNVVNKLYNKLKSVRNHKEVSGSEITSATYTSDDVKKSEKYCYDDFTLSSLDSVRVSVDTVQSVTQTVIKRLAKSYPKEKRA